MKPGSRHNRTIVIAMLLAIKVFPQKQTINDLALWPTITVQKKVTSAVSFKLISRARITENISRLDSYYFDIGCFYEIRKNFKISLDYVFAPTRLPNASYRRIHQYYLSINNKIDLNSLWALKNRFILQHGSSYFVIDNGYKPYSKTNIREKLGIVRKLNRRNSAYIEDEIMSPLDHGPLEIRRNRLYMGISYQLSKQISFDYYFILQSIMHQKATINSYILGFTLGYQF